MPHKTRFAAASRAEQYSECRLLLAGRLRALQSSQGVRLPTCAAFKGVVEAARQQAAARRNFQCARPCSRLACDCSFVPISRVARCEIPRFPVSDELSFFGIHG